MSEVSSYVSTKNSIGKYDFIVRQNQIFITDLKFDKKLGYSPLDLTILHHKTTSKTASQHQLLLSYHWSSGLEIIGADSNILKVAMTINQTKPLTCETYYYDVLTATPTANIYYLKAK
jgi:hypothetical protein